MQYSYARISSILSKIEHSKRHPKEDEPSDFSAWMEIDNKGFSLLKEVQEKALLLKLAEFSDVLEKAAQEYKPNFVARWALELAKLFNTYYQKHKIIVDDEHLQAARLTLVSAVAIGLKKALSLLGIEVLEKM